MNTYDKFISRAGIAMRESAIRQMGTVLAQAKDMISFAPGYPAEDAFPWSAFAEMAASLFDGSDGSVLQYGPTRGFKPLREACAALMTSRGISSVVERIVVTTGSQQGLDLLARVLVDPGDVILMELPSYTGAITAFRNVGASLVGVRQDDHGVELDHLDDTWQQASSSGHAVKFLYLVPNFQNPTGRLLSLERRRAILEWAERRDVLIVEDDPYRDLYFPDVTEEHETRPIAADDHEGARVIYLSSFSKTLAPGFRVGWMSAPAAIAGKLELAKQAEDLCTGGFDQRVAYEAWRSGLLARHVPTLRTLYQHKRDVMAATLAREMGDRMRWIDPRGGFFLWAEITSLTDCDTLLRHARTHGVIFVAGSAFYVDGTGQQTLRLSFSAPSPERIEEGCKRLARAMDEALSQSAR